MELISTPLKDCFVIKVEKFGDDRGFFTESFHKEKFRELGIEFDVKQINFVKSAANIIRGLHFQRNEFAQSKLVSVFNGSALDIVVDIRPDSPTYLGNFKYELNNPSTFIYVPKGFAHGYKSLEDGTLFFYAVDNYYSPENEGGIRFDDPNLQIDWELDADPILSEKDLNQPYLNKNN